MRDRPVRVIIVDDSLVFREVLARGVASDSGIEVVAKAVDPYDARDKILQYRPDVMICNVEMPKMNGIEFLKRLLPQYPIPAIVVSAMNASVFDALNAGAVDFAAKPDMQSVHSVEAFLLDLIQKVKACARATPGLPAQRPAEPAVPAVPGPDINLNAVIAVGASTGGTEAVYRLLKGLPSPMPGMVIVQHIPPVFSGMFAERLNQTTGHRVKEAESGDILEAGKVLVAPGNRHMRIRKSGTRYKVELYEGEKVNGHCPSVDILFESVAREAGSRAVGVILTGMGYDGAKGLLSMRRKGARTIGQDEKSSVVYGMPKVAYDIGAVEKQAALNEMPGLLCSLLKI